eukprot:NODE_5312_length_692_cov_9.583204_g4938_i0.p1 GENE.NODE_5312_length_692_cov_9.583204_g4938_i0~~NODE_5312_length_692_cov_9.583204_g4938_i0.p1  ORF type:complete len:168 (+),score=34.20 NODE_5312_length_692_cov_9.583204_g4938_i0:40-543(+)
MLAMMRMMRAPSVLSKGAISQRLLSSTAVPASLGRINHIAIAVPKSKSIAETGNMYATLFGAKVSEPQDLPDHGVTTVFVEFGNTKIELLHPLGPKSPIAGFLEKNSGGGIHHVCVEVDNIAEGIARAQSLGIRALSKEPRIGAHGKPVMFFHPKDCGGVLTEMEEI